VAKKLGEENKRFANTVAVARFRFRLVKFVSNIDIDLHSIACYFFSRISIRGIINPAANSS